MDNLLKNLRVKIVVIIICFSAIVAVTIALLSFFISRRYLSESQQQSAFINLQLLGNEMNASLNSVQTFTGLLELDSSVEDYLVLSLKLEPGASDKDYNKFSVDIWNHLSDEYRTNPAHDLIDRFVISTPDGASFLHIVRSQSNTVANLTENIINAPFFEPLLNAGGYEYTGPVESPAERNGGLVLPLVRPVKSYDTSEIVGFIYVETSFSLLTDNFKNLELPKDSALYISFCDSVWQYADGTFTEASLPEGVVTYKLPDKNISLSLLPSKNELFLRSRLYSASILIVLFLIIISGAIISVRLRKMIEVPVEALIQEKLSHEREKQALEYRILQEQINPHFMYNTLNTIKWMARSSVTVCPSFTFSRIPLQITGSRPRLTALRKKIRAKESASTAEAPMLRRAIGACSRLEPQPKFRPATTIPPSGKFAAMASSTPERQWLPISTGSVRARKRPG